MRFSEDILEAENQIEAIKNSKLGFKHCRFKGNTTTQSYTPTPQELKLQNIETNYAEAIAPNSLNLNDFAASMMYTPTYQKDANGNIMYNEQAVLDQNGKQVMNADGTPMTTKTPIVTGYDNKNWALGVDSNSYGKLNDDAQQQIATAQQRLGNLQSTNDSALGATNNKLEDLYQGQLSDAYLQNMSDAISRSMNNTMGQSLNSLANRGVLNSSVTNQALNDIQGNTANALAQQYLNSLATAKGIANDQLSNTLSTNQLNASINNDIVNNATAGITAQAAAQEAALETPLNLWNASTGLNSSTTSALGAIGGKGTTSTTSSGGSGLLGGLLGGLF